ncbi:LPXTG cell wall anchor domain-containing protein [Actinoplanes utahensis]|uniref:LPXTG cell wall anchor domain-containing protein n=1 Tax=Actinoplanes utahensis TaxID=1869 RepID=UPI001A5D6C7E|nr:LPXTG cell wall anchor domain-containing protein [Actinoplanes utahensis]GIF35306.1 hypothetical protein Aut01nite_82920 [Actinoplanes utahensis]
MKHTPRVRRVMAVLAGALLGLTALANPAGATPAAEKSFSHTFKVEKGVAVATVTAHKTLDRPVEVTLVSYFAPKPSYSVPQYVYQSKTAALSQSNTVIELSIEVPDCNTQVDLFFGGQKDVIDPLDGSRLYGDKKLGEDGFPGNLSEGPQGWDNSGNKACVQPAVQEVPQCDGAVDIQLSNNGKLSKYDVEFRVTATGFDKKVKVAAGKGETVTVPAGAGTITVTAPGLKDYTYTWSRPATCVPSAGGANDCKTVTITVTNPKGNKPAKADVTYGTETKSVVVAPNTSELVTFPAGEPTTATVAYPEITGTEPETVTITKSECPAPTTPATTTPSTTTPATTAPTTAPATETPGATPSETATTTSAPVDTTPVAGNDDDGELPLTGAAAGSIAGGAAVLLLAGVGLFFMARRRKLNFKA